MFNGANVGGNVTSNMTPSASVQSDMSAMGAPAKSVWCGRTQTYLPSDRKCADNVWDHAAGHYVPMLSSETSTWDMATGRYVSNTKGPQ